MRSREIIATFAFSLQTFAIMSLDLGKVAKTQQRLAEEASNKKSSLFSNLLIASTSMLGIVVSLHTPTEIQLYIRLVFVVALLLFVFGILAVAIVLHSHIMAVKQLRALYAEECIRALREDRSPDMVQVNPSRLYRFCEKAGYICLAAGLLTLTTYAILLTLTV